MWGRLGTTGGGVGTKSRTEGSGVVTRNELMYFVSAISKFSNISSLSSMSNASSCVSLMRWQGQCKSLEGSQKAHYPMENKLWMSISASMSSLRLRGCSSPFRLVLFSPFLGRALFRFPCRFAASFNVELKPIFTR